MFFTRADIPHRNGPGVGNVVSDELHKSRGTFPGAASNVLDPATEHRCIFGKIIVIESVSGAVTDGAIAIGDRLLVMRRRLLDSFSTDTSGIKTFSRHPGGVTVFHESALGSAKGDRIAMLGKKSPHMRIPPGGQISHFLHFGKATETTETQAAKGYRATALDGNAGALSIAKFEDSIVFVLPLDGNTVRIVED